MSPTVEEALRLLRLAHRDADTFALLRPLPKASMSALGFHALNPFTVEFRYDDEMQSSLSRQELASILCGVHEWADGKVASAQPPS
jgi:hypothetical protein